MNRAQMEAAGVWSEFQMAKANVIKYQLGEPKKRIPEIVDGEEQERRDRFYPKDYLIEKKI